jgi:hypothetical protein
MGCGVRKVINWHTYHSTPWSKKKWSHWIAYHTLWLINLTFLNSYHNMQLKKTEIAVVVSPTFLHFVFCFVKFYLLFCRCQLFRLTKIKWFLFHRFSLVMVILFKPLNISMFSSLQLNLNSLRVYPLLLA